MAVESMTVVQPSTSTTTKSSTDLVEASNALITGFTGHAMHALALKNELLDRNNSSSNGTGNGNSGDASNPLGRSTATESYTSYTNLSDGSSAYTVDPNDLKRLDDEMALFKTHFSHVKMQWIESSVKRKTLERLLDASVAEEAGLVSRDMLAEMERERDASKHGLKERKVQAESLRRDIHLVAGQLDVALNQQLAPTIDEARSLTRSIQDMELELAMLRNSVPEEERMTVDEANAYLDEQIVSLQALAEQLERNKTLIQERKQVLAGKQRELERLSSERHSAEKLEAEARHATRNKDRRIEENCRQLADRTALMASVLGIKAIQPCPNGELRIVYDLSSGRAATLAIYSDAIKRRLVGAELLNSNTDISDIVARSVESGDLQELVLEVLVRIA